MTEFDPETDAIARAAAALDDAFAVALRPRHLVPRTGDVVDRRDLTDPDAVVERMARDILAARCEGALGLIDLTEAGWTLAQAVRWGPTAHDLAATPAFATQDVVERLRARETETDMSGGIGGGR